MKDTARLSASLLVRKGDAAPALMADARLGYHRPNGGAPVRPVPATSAEAPVAKATPAGAAPRTPSHDRAPRTGGSGPRIAMTLRLDSARHLRLKLLAAHEGKSCQALLLEALDAMIAQHAPEVTECACLQGTEKKREAAPEGTVPRRRVRA